MARFDEIAAADLTVDAMVGTVADVRIDSDRTVARDQAAAEGLAHQVAECVLEQGGSFREP